MKKLLLVLLCLALVLSIIQIANASEETKNPSFGLDFQFQVFTIDLKTEVVYSSNYYARMWTSEPAVKGFEAVMLRPDYNDGIRFLSGNVSGNQQIYEQIQTDPAKVSTPWEWRLNAKRFLLGSPFDHYELSFLIAVNMSITLDINNTWVIVPFSMRGDWSWDEHPMVRELAEPPDNQTLASLGLSSQRFYQYGCENMADFYLITITFSFPTMYSTRIAIAYLLPSMTILLVLAVASARFKRLSISDFLTLYLGAGLFILSFVVSFYQYAPSKVLTWQEAIFYFDFLFVTGLVVAALKGKKSTKDAGNSAGTEPADPKNKGDMSDKEQLRVQRLISQLSSRESSTLIVSTIAASVSLAILAVVMQSMNGPLSDSAFVIGVAFSFIGFVYREATVFFVDPGDYNVLKLSALPLTPSSRSREAAIFSRMFMVRFLLLMPIAAWLEVRLPPESQSSMWAVSITILCGVAFALSVVEHFHRNDP